eukprot:scaffold408_cov71-Cylindrotheca_fusiformis.AAC.18
MMSTCSGARHITEHAVDDPQARPVETLRTWSLRHMTHGTSQQSRNTPARLSSTNDQRQSERPLRHTNGIVSTYKQIMITSILLYATKAHNGKGIQRMRHIVGHKISHSTRHTPLYRYCTYFQRGHTSMDNQSNKYYSWCKIHGVIQQRPKDLIGILSRIIEELNE